MKAALDISIVIPALNEAGKIGGDVLTAVSFLAREGFSGEVIIVDDGSSDGTAAAAEAAETPDGAERELRRIRRL